MSRSGQTIRRSLSLRLTMMVFLMQTIVITIFAVALHHEAFEVMEESFDDSLQGNAEALATLVAEDDDDEDSALELEYVDEVMRRFTHDDRPDLFAIMLPVGTVLQKSRMLETVPSQAIDPDKKKEYFYFNFEGNPYRGIVIETRLEHEAEDADSQELVVFYSISAHPLLHENSELVVLLIFMTGLCLLISALLSYMVARLGLRPLRRLAGEVSYIREDSLYRRLSSGSGPTELAEISSAINLFLERIEKSFERERRFSTDAAHELRTPIATLKSGVQAALLNLPAGDEVRHTLEEQLIDIERLEELCNFLLLAVRGSGDTGEGSTLTAGEWTDHVYDAAEALRPQAESNQVTLVLEIPDPPEGLRLRCDVFSCSRIVTNLVANAIQHGGRGVNVNLSVQWREDSAILCVEDNGPGVAPHDVPRLFERFYRGDASRTHGTGGYGLGLPICQTLAETFEGQIRYETARSGGCRFLWSVRGINAPGSDV